MWIILLDHSSSMGSGFENEPKTGKLVKASGADTRLGAAKEILLELLTRWAPGDRVLLLPFTRTVRRIGPLQAGDRAEFEKELASIQPKNGTDIAAALNAAADEAEASGKRATVFLISDGQSNHKEALAAAERCDKLGVTVFVYAIDPDEQAETLALRIASATGGSWDPVSSRKKLQEATSKSAARVEAQAKAAAEMVERFEREHRELAKQKQASDEVLFTAAHPRRIAPKQLYPLLLAVHCENELEAVERNFRGELTRRELSAQLTSTESLMRLPRGTVLEVEPRLPGMLVSPRRAEVVWLGMATIASFEMRTLHDEVPQELVEGEIEITVQQGLLVGRTPVTFRIMKDSDERADLPELTTGRLIDRVFASYAHEDEPVVLACRAVYKGLDIQLFVDHEDIQSGEVWSEALAKAIGGCDLFQLFWSEASAASAEVKKEWLLALGVARQKHRHFVRPVHWRRRDPVPDPPPQLGAFHFRYLDLSLLELEEKRAGVKPTSAVAAQLEFGSQLTILPLASDGGEITDLIRKEMGRVVAFLEAVTGLRYIPAPTLLVDHYTIRSVREQLTVDKSDEDAGSDAPQEENEWAILLLRGLLLAFHVRKLQGKEFDDSQTADFFGLSDVLALGDFSHIRRVSEASITQLLKDRLRGREDCPGSDDGSEAIKKASSDPVWGSFALKQYIAHLAAVCSDDDRQKLELHFGRWLHAEGPRERANIDKRDVAAVVQAIMEPAIVDLRQRYAGGIYTLFDSEKTTLCRAPNVATYLRRCLELVEGYAEQAHSRRGDVAIEISFAVPLSVLQRAQAELNLNLSIKGEQSDWSGRGTGEHSFSLPLSHYGRAIGRLRERLLQAVAATPTPARRLRRLVEVIVPTYGICVLPGRTGVEEKIVAAALAASWPEAAALPGTTKVLVCREAVDELRAQLTTIGETPNEIDAKISGLIRTVLAHEHFHASLAYGLDRFGRAAGAVASGRVWDRGRSLNEALAAWMELHFSRDDPWLFERVTEWVMAGDYATWPYRGALALERLYEEQKLQAIRELITTFRADPQLAQERFDSPLYPSAPSAL